MNQLRLRSLSLKNFKGLRTFRLQISGDNISIFGDNATGKTTLKDAFSWILFDRDGQGRADFDIKTIDQKTGEALHNLDHEVEAVLEMNGKDITLKKTYHEKWTQQRGSAKKTFTGHTTNHFIDGVPVKKNEYDSRISEIAGSDDVFKLLTDPAYFNEQLHWQKRREILLEVCGNISDVDVIASNKKLTSLEDILSNRSIEDHRKILQARKKEINQQLEKIPVRIDEVTQGLPDISNIQPKRIQEEKEKLEKEKQVEEQELLRTEHGGEIAEKTKRLREIETELLELKNKHWEKSEKEIQELQRELDIERGSFSRIQESIWSLEKTCEHNKNEIAEIQRDLEELRQEWEDTDSTKFEFEQSDTCPTCGQKLPAERLQEARDKTLALFNQDKAKKLESITESGKLQKAELEKLQRENEEDINKKVQELNKERKQVEISINDLKAKIKTVQEQRTEGWDISQDADYQNKLQGKQAQEKLIEELKEKLSETVEKLKTEIEILRDGIGFLEYSLSQMEQHKRGQIRIEELEVQEKQFACEFEKLEKELWLLEEFTKQKVSLLEEKINSKFFLARFKLFNPLVNQGIEEIAETLYEQIPYSTALNKGAQVAVGLDIINTLSEHYGFRAPIFIDNAEAFVLLPEVNGQLIKMYVSGKDKSLRVEQ